MEKERKGLIGLGVITAIASSLCCLTPVLALLAGSSGAASSFSWLEPARPYLMALTILVLGFAWWQKLRPERVDDCGCAAEKKPKWHQSKPFLGIVTLFAILMMLFPYYSSVFYPENNTVNNIGNEGAVREIKLSIEGMTCDACQDHVDHSVREVDGVVSVHSSYADENVVIEYDTLQTGLANIIEAINSTGYQVKEDE